VRWYVHALWGLAVMTLLGAPAVTAVIASAAHTAATDIAGHSGWRRNRWHNAISLVAALALALALGCPQALALGPLHVALDLLSPGRLAVSRWYNIAWSLPAAAIIVIACAPSPG
jgi:hypothetical protein